MLVCDRPVPHRWILRMAMPTAARCNLIEALADLEYRL